MTTWYGAVNGVRATWYFDSGADTCFISEKEGKRMGLKATRAPPLHVRHSSGAVETSERRVNNARLELHTGWIVLVDLYVLKQMPAVGMIIGTDFMHDKEAQIKMRADGSTSIELTVGRRRLLLAPGVNQV